MMTTEATLGYAGAPMNEGAIFNRGLAGLDGQGAGTAQEVKGGEPPLNRNEQARNYAIWMFRQGSCAAEVWEALVARGVDEDLAEATVKDVLEHRRKIDEAAHQAAMVEHSMAQENLGSFWVGALLGLFLGWIALILSFVPGIMGSETKQGVRVIFAVKLFITLAVIIGSSPR